MSDTVKTIWQKNQCQIYFTSSKTKQKNKQPQQNTKQKQSKLNKSLVNRQHKRKSTREKNCKAKTLYKKLNHQTKRNTIVDYNQKHNNKLQNKNMATIFCYWKDWKRFSNNGSKPESILTFPWQ